MFTRVDYSKLNARQKENYNFQKVAGRLADYGFNCLRLNDDWHGADFLAVHVDGNAVLRVQLKGRFSFDTKYRDRGLHITFFANEDCYVYPHDDVLAVVEKRGRFGETISWAERGSYTWPSLPAWAVEILAQYRV
ncbi:hypothetical protein [Sinorhizobium meliloti]|uniref:hypothetical protein n=1 Tax=Rhizobium meliloti TaxID=382 RepID=UPI000FD92F30|nr:hypothetical protein [Sinorhizobium meliloti]MDW9906033.1 hypothetical protein [Sinorhizobium meliloti]MQX73352.1 hypothetical protein [Sinorhizobium meliloti]RVG48932.1 hypothetical protein CN226_24030 [Sinorhizobium meliloti]RVL59323.1 hypothetical protein CN141_15450 [Sinorhizobium meliloti]